MFDRPPSAQPHPGALVGFVNGVYEESVRLALASPSGREIWVARAPGDYVVIADTVPGGPTGAGAEPAAALARRGGVFLGGGGSGDGWYMTGLVADGYTLASGGGRSVPIRDNVFLFEGGTPFSEVTVSGPAGARILR